MLIVSLYFQIGGQPERQRPDIPVIHVRNDQYQPAQPHTVYPPREPHTAYPPREPKYIPSELEDTVYYSESQPQSVLQRTVPNDSGLTKTVRSESPKISVHHAPIKRKAPSGGPLKLSSTNTVPVIETPVGRSSESAIKYSKITVAEPPAKKVKEEVSDKASKYHNCPNISNTLFLVWHKFSFFYTVFS